MSDIIERLIIRLDQIPPEVVDATAKAILESDGWTWKYATEARRAVYRCRARAAIAAALAAWPGMEWHEHLAVRDNGEGYDLKRTGIILPLQENANADG